MKNVLSFDTDTSKRIKTSGIMYVNKWYSLVAAILLQLMGGLCYTFSLYSSALKTALNVDQASLEFLASCLLSGGYFSWIPGERARPKCAPVKIMVLLQGIPSSFMPSREIEA
jgi:hypothetical protein